LRQQGLAFGGKPPGIGVRPADAQWLDCDERATGRLNDVERDRDIPGGSRDHNAGSFDANVVKLRFEDAGDLCRAARRFILSPSTVVLVDFWRWDVFMR